ncbi:hypothetical protein [Sphingomicrobium arenosum]|uniref:hypothetical protein n=1 Tax=Sphingomicrobium arenosum TaxID=2233861 RepID=UPI0022403C37|nr:hypothetical protein [Sphingomicrobium arenosum]
MFMGNQPNPQPVLSSPDLIEVEATGEGSFIEDLGALNALFADPDARGSRKWGDIFDPAACQEADLEAILSELPKL